MLERSDISCGVRQLFDFREYRSPEKMLFESLEDSDDRFPLRFKFILFSDTTTRKRYLTGAKFAAFVTKNKLGVITTTKIRTNPNTNNRIRVWLWDINRKALTKWYKDYEKAENKYDEDDDEDEDNSYYIMR